MSSKLIVVNEDDQLLKVTQSPDISVVVSPPSTSRISVAPPIFTQTIVVTSDDKTVLKVSAQPRASINVTSPPKPQKLVVSSGPALRATSLAQLSDVSVDTWPPIDRSALLYDAPEAVWVPSPVVEPADLTDAINQHINSPTPHPAYDNPEGPSLVLLYQNAKV